MSINLNPSFIVKPHLNIKGAFIISVYISLDGLDDEGKLML